MLAAYRSAGALAVVGVLGVFAALRYSPNVIKRVSPTGRRTQVALFLLWFGATICLSTSFLVSAATHAAAGPHAAGLCAAELRRTVMAAAAFFICRIVIRHCILHISTRFSNL
ncbi:MAG: hypothetical protein HYX78_00745 [Armatimonadetes bacterium]|nr:hypothetical protein [Armatimonadota bacterium]